MYIACRTETDATAWPRSLSLACLPGGESTLPGPLVLPPLWPSGKAPSRARQTWVRFPLSPWILSQAESYLWLKTWHSSGYPVWWYRVRAGTGRFEVSVLWLGEIAIFFFRSPAKSLGFTTFGWDFCVCDRFFNPTIKVVTFPLRGWCVLGVFFVAGIHPSRTWTSGSFESVRWNACVHRLDLGLYSHPKEFLGDWSLNPC